MPTQVSHQQSNFVWNWNFSLKAESGITSNSHCFIHLCFLAYISFPFSSLNMLDWCNWVSLKNIPKHTREKASKTCKYVRKKMSEGNWEGNKSYFNEIRVWKDFSLRVWRRWAEIASRVCGQDSAYCDKCCLCALQQEGNWDCFFFT